MALHLLGGTPCGPNPIKVVCRIRGKGGAGAKENAPRIRALNGTEVQVPEVRLGSKGLGGDKVYEVDSVFDVGTSQFDVYKSVGIPAVSTLLKGGGRTVTVISCGAEGTGKTFTLFGDVSGKLAFRDDHRGLIVRMIDSAFTRLSQASTPSSPDLASEAPAVKNSNVSITMAQVLIGQDDSVTDTLEGPDDVDYEVSVIPAPSSDQPHVAWQSVFAGHKAVTVTSRDVALAVLNASLPTKQLRGDRVLLLKLRWVDAASVAQTSHLLCVDCSPVHSKSMHNLRDVASYLTLNTASQTSIPYSKSKLTTLLRGDFTLTTSNATRIIVHCKASHTDLDIFDSSSILNFAVLVKKVKREYPSCSTDSDTPRDSPPVPTSPVQESLSRKGSSDRCPVPLAPSPSASPTPSARAPSPALSSPGAGRGRLTQNAHQLFTTYLQSLTQQLREKEEMCRQVVNDMEHSTALLSREQDRNKVLMSRVSDLEQKLRQAEAVARTQGVCYKCNASPLRLLTDAEDGDGEDAPDALDLLLPLESKGRRGSNPDIQAGLCGDDNGATSSPLEVPMTVTDQAGGESDTESSESQSDHGEHSGQDSGVADIELESASSSDSREVLPTAANGTMAAKVERYRARLQRAKLRAKKLHRAVAFAREQSAQLNRQVEESEKQKQEIIGKYLAVLSRLDENRKWMKKIKRSLQAEKEAALEKKNEEFRARKLAIEAALDVELPKRVMERTEALKDKVQSLQAMVSHLSAEYNRRVTDAAVRREDVGDDQTKEELRAENEALRSNIASLMKVMEHCYMENTHLSSLSSRLSSRLGEANDRIQTLEASWEESIGEQVDGSGTPRRPPPSPRRRSMGKLSPADLPSHRA